MEIQERFVHPQNESSISVTPLGILMDCKAVQPENVKFPIIETLLEIFTDCNEEQP